MLVVKDIYGSWYSRCVLKDIYIAHAIHNKGYIVQKNARGKLSKRNRDEYLPQGARCCADVQN